MRYSRFLILILIISFSLNGFAQIHYGNLVGFQVLSSYLDNGKVKINNATSSTTIQFTASFSRQTDNYPNWKYFEMSVVLGTVKNGSVVFFTGVQTIKNSDFQVGVSFLTKTFSSTITNAELLSGQKIMLFFQTPQMSQVQYYTSTLYDFVLTGSSGGDEDDDNEGIPWFDPFVKYSKTKTVNHKVPPPSGSSYAWYPSATVPIISRGEVVYSQNGHFYLNLQSTDGNLVLSDNTTHQALWAANVPNCQKLMFMPDGNLKLFYANGQVAWESGFWVDTMHEWYISNKAYFIFQGDGNLVLEFDRGTKTDIIASTGTGANPNTGSSLSIHFGELRQPN